MRSTEETSASLRKAYGSMVEFVDGMVEFLDMSLNIKNEETHRLARQLAAATGESMATAVTKAVRERLHRVQVERRGGLAARLLEIGRDCATHLKGPVDHDALLYGEDGLPR